MRRVPQYDSWKLFRAGDVCWMMADLVLGWLQNTGKDLMEYPLAAEDDAIAEEDLLEPMLQVTTR